MNIVIVTTDSFTSYLLISDVVSHRPSDVASIVITPSRVSGRGIIGTVRYVWQKSGLVSLTQRVVTNLWMRFAEGLHRLGLLRHSVTPSNLARRYGINLYRSRDCNDEASLAHIRSKQPDILLSINVYQRMQEQLLSIPRIAAVNNHFGLLPKYRGMAPYVWAMANGEREVGLSVHHMVLSFDAGRLIRQERLPVRPGESAFGVCVRGCLVARRMITEAVEHLSWDPDYGFEQVGEGSYFSMPTRKCIARLRQRGHGLIRIRDLLDVLRDRLCGEYLP